MPAALRARAGTAQPGEPLFVLSKVDGLLRGGFEVAPQPQPQPQPLPQPQP